MSRLQDKLSLLNQKHLQNGSLLKKGSSSKPRFSFGNEDSVSPQETWKPDTSIFTPVPNRNLVGNTLESNIPALKTYDGASIKKQDSCFHIEREMSSFWNQWSSFNDDFYQQTKEETRSRDIVKQAADLKLLNYSSDLEPNWMFLDIETCGFAGNPLFLIGVAYFHEQKLHLHQLFARNYNEEVSVLRDFWNILEEKKETNVLVTFNGKSFDWPFVQERAWVHGVIPSFDMETVFHLDLMHLARKAWKAKLPNCKLQTLEKHLLNRYRVGDVHGGLIPEAYHRYAENPEEWELIAGAIHHNALDIISLAELLLYWNNSEEN